MDRRVRRQLMERLLADARIIAGQFGLEYRVIEAERSNVTSRYGICYDDGTIKIRLAHSVSGEPLKYSSIVSTLCHELAHLRHFDHGPKFRVFYAELLAWARKRGIYTPGGASPVVPTLSPSPQLDLGTAIRTGRLPTLRESLKGVLGPPPDGVAAPRAAPRAAPAPTGTRSPSQLELFP